MSVTREDSDFVLFKQFSPLNELAREQLLDVAATSTALQLEKGESLDAVAPRDCVVFLLAGTVDRVLGNDRSELIHADTERARYAIFSPQEDARVFARSEASVLCVDSRLLEALLARREADESQSDSHDWVDGLMRSEVVANLSPASIQALLGALEPVQFGADEIIFNQGEAPDYYYIVSRGRCVVTRREAGQQSLLQLAALGPGGTFGEDALIASSSRNATVKTVDPSVVLRLRPDEFRKRLEQPLVRMVDQREVGALRGKGAVMLYIHFAAAYVKSEKGITIPYAELRARMRGLDGSVHYVVISDNVMVSAAAAFLLTQNGFKVSLPKRPATSAAPPAPRTALEHVAARLERDLADVHERLKEEERSHSATTERVTQLEIELEATRAGAKAAMKAATEKRTRSELALRDKITALESKHVELLRQIDGSRNELASRLQELSQRESQQTDRIHQLQRELSHISGLKVSAESANKNLAEQVGILQTELAALQRSSEHANDAKRRTEEKNEELLARVDNMVAAHRAIEAQCATLEATLAEQRENNAGLHAELGALAAEKAALEKRLADLEPRFADMRFRLAAQADSQLKIQRHLKNQVHDANQKLQQTVNEVQALGAEKSALETRLAGLLPTIESLERQIETLESERSKAVSHGESLAQMLRGVESALDQAQQDIDRSREETVRRQADIEAVSARAEQAERQLLELDKARNEVHEKLEAVTKASAEQLAAAEKTRQELETKLSDKEAALAESNARVSELESELSASRTEAADLRDRAAKDEATIKSLNDEVASLSWAKRRRGAAIVLLFTLLICLLVGATTGAIAGFMGLDFRLVGLQLFQLISS